MTIYSQPLGIGQLKGRRLFLMDVAHLEALPATLAPVEGRFALLVAGDFRPFDYSRLATFTQRLLDLGAVYTVSWGPKSGEVETHFDCRIVERELQGGAPETQDNHISTVSMEKEPLDEALWFFLALTDPSPDYEATCKSGLIVVVGDPGLSARIADLLRDPPAFLNRVAQEEANDPEV